MLHRLRQAKGMGVSISHKICATLLLRPSQPILGVGVAQMWQIGNSVAWVQHLRLTHGAAMQHCELRMAGWPKPCFGKDRAKGAHEVVKMGNVYVNDMSQKSRSWGAKIRVAQW